MKRKNILIISAVVAAIMLIWIFTGSKSKTGESLKTEVRKGLFEVTVTTTGELKAKNSQDIMGPSDLRSSGIWQVKISDIIPEGTIVQEGDYIATLDRQEVANKLKELENEVQKNESQFTQTKLDTTLTMRGARDELVNLKYFMEEKKIGLEQSKFEPPATIRQAEIELDKAERSFNQAVENYKIKNEQSAAKMQEVSATLNIQRQKYEQMQKLIEKFVITAPKGGMVIYIREWDGKKKAVGANISPWDLAVATLPDLSMMTVNTYVNEIDIRKIKEGQQVRIGVDAFPEKKFTGKVTSVANVGEQKPNSDAKVFEVEILVNESDSILRPAMTTSNSIVANSYKDVLYIPLEAVQTKDSTTFVYKNEGFGMVKKEVKLGATNENEVIVEKGLKEGDKIFLSVPKDADDLKLVKLGK